MIIDFHTHSHASDGALSPADLLDQAIEAGISQFAITDHDTVAGYRQALVQRPNLPPGFSLVPGVELSCVWSNMTIHVVGLDVDVDHPVLLAAMEQLEGARQQRAEIIAEKLAKVGIPGALEGALTEAGVSQIGRPHFAKWMIAAGHVANANDAFDKYLGAGKLGDVKTCWPELAEVVDWVNAAGGTAIMAHPLKYKMTRMKLRRLLAAFSDAGGRGLEVYSGRQTADQTIALCKLADELGLVASAGSDFHQHFEYGPRLGVDVTRLPGFIELYRSGAGR